MASIVPSERLRRELQDLVAGAGEEPDPIEAIGRLGARLIAADLLPLGINVAVDPFDVVGR